MVAESYILILKGLGHNAAVSFLEKVNSSPRIVRLCSTSDMETEAEKILRKYQDRGLSVTQLL